jgi:hypothetical protein
LGGLARYLAKPSLITKPAKTVDMIYISSRAFVGRRFQVLAFERCKITSGKGRGPSGQK